MWWKPRSSHSRNCAACDCSPGRSSIAGTGSSAGPVAPPVASAGVVATIGVALPVVAGPSRQPTTVPIVTSAGPSGSVSVTVSSVVVQAIPIAADRLRRADADPRSAPGGASCGSSDTLSPLVTILPSRASRSIVGGTAVIASGVPATTTRRASRSGAGATVTWSPSRTPRLPSSRSSQSTSPRAPSETAATAPVVRAPVSRTASQGDSPSAASTSRCSRTTPRRASSRAPVSRAVNVSACPSDPGFATPGA